MIGTTLVTPTRTLLLYGKNGTSLTPTKAYPKATMVHLEAELIKDFGNGVAVWKFPAYKDVQPEKFWVYNHHKNGSIGSGGECTSLEAALDRAARSLVWQEYTERKREMYQAFNEEMAALEAEYKGRV
jgi:hypothetical protein